MSTPTYSHLVEIDEKTGLLTIYRVYDADRQLYTSVNLPKEKWAEDPEAMAEFCRLLGENILLDSPQARKLLDI